jgi:hypothetical protein
LAGEEESMRRLILIATLIAAPQVGQAATQQLRLLEKRTLAFAPFGSPVRPHGVLQTDDAPPPPPMPPAEPVGVPEVAGTEEVPSLGSVLGFMISGGAVLVPGVIFTIYGLFFIAVGASTPRSCPGTYCTDVGGAMVAGGVVVLIFGLILDGVGTTLLLVGNAKRITRARILSPQNISFNFDPKAKAPMLGYAFNF